MHAVNTYGPITDRTFPPVHTVNISNRSQLPYPIHRPHHTRPLSPQALNIPPPVAGRSFDPPPTGTTQPKQPDNPTQRSNVAAPSPQPQEVDIIEIDEDEEDNGSNLSDGENDDGPDNTIDLLAVSEFSSESGVKVMFPQQIRSRSNPAISVLLKCQRSTAALENQWSPSSHSSCPFEAGPIRALAGVTSVLQWPLVYSPRPHAKPDFKSSDTRLRFPQHKQPSHGFNGMLIGCCRNSSSSSLCSP